MIGLVAVSALLVWGWMTYFDPVRRWKVAIRDKYDEKRRGEAIDDAVNGRVAGINSDLAAAELVGLLGDKSRDPSVRWTAMVGLPMFKIKARGAIPSLIAVVRDDPPEMKISALLALWMIVGHLPEDDHARRDAVTALVAAMKDPDHRVRRLSACVLGWIGDGEVAIPTLIEALDGPALTSTERMQVIEALRRSGPKAVDALPAVLAVAEVALIDGGTPGTEGNRWIEAQAQIQAARFIRASGETGRAVAILRRLAGDEDPRVAKEASKVLAAVESTKSSAGSEALP
jgi:HEAT repeat protein